MITITAEKARAASTARITYLREKDYEYLTTVMLREIKLSISEGKFSAEGNTTLNTAKEVVEQVVEELIEKGYEVFTDIVESEVYWTIYWHDNSKLENNKEEQ